MLDKYILPLDGKMTMKKDDRYDQFLLRNKNLITLLGVFLSAVFVAYGLRSGILTNTNKMDTFIQSFGFLAPIIFIVIQIVQVVIPIVPGAVSCVLGIVAFGPVYGLLLNYVGIVIGSVIAFRLGREYGGEFVRAMTGDKFFIKYSKYLSKEYHYDKVFLLLMFFPLSPDDFLCYLSGMSKMTFKKFMTILLLSKPLSITFYSYGLIKIMQLVSTLRH